MAVDKQTQIEIDQIAQEAAQDEILNPPSLDENGKPVEEKKPDPKAEAGAIVTLATETLVGAYPELASVYTPERNAKIADAFAYTFSYYGMTLGGFMGHPFFILGAALLPVIPPTYKAATRSVKHTEVIDQDQPAQPMAPIEPATDPASLHNRA